MVALSSVPVRGSTGNDVLALQRQLAQKGFDPGHADGIFGPKTAAAISACQKKAGLPGGGELGPKTLALLDLEVIPSSPSQGTSITRPFPRKHSGRHLHPTLRLLLEAKVFPGGVVPISFTSRQIPQMLIAAAKGMAALGIKESDGQNHGVEVGYIQAIIGPYRAGGNGDSWCMETDQCLVAFIEDYFQIESPYPTSEGCVEVWGAATKVPGLSTKDFEVGCFFIGQHQTDKAHGHTGTVLADAGKGMMSTFEGNRSNAAYIAPRSKEQTGDLKTLGFVRLFPNNQV